MAKIYLETSLVSYLVALPSRNPIMAARQQLTIDWWNNESVNHTLYASDTVLDEASRGDVTESAKRLAVLAGLPILSTTTETIALANSLLAEHALPRKAYLDALHIAIASVHAMDYLLTWNCKHIANAIMRPKIQATCRMAGYSPPTIGTLEQFTW